MSGFNAGCVLYLTLKMTATQYFETLGATYAYSKTQSYIPEVLRTETMTVLFLSLDFQLYQVSLRQWRDMRNITNIFRDFFPSSNF